MGVENLRVWGVTINGAGTYAKAQSLIGLNLTTPVSGRLFAPDTRATVSVRMMVIAGIPSSVPGDFAENTSARRARTCRYHRNEADLLGRLKGLSKGLLYVPVRMIVGPL